MEYRLLGRSGLKVSAITLGTMTMGGKGDFAQVGNVGVKEARRQIDLCLDAGVNLIDTANVYSDGASEEIIGEALGGKRKNGVLIATKARFAMGDGPNDERRLALSSDPRLRGQPEAAAHRCHRSLPAPSMGRRDAAGGDAGGPRQPGPARARALHRLLELFRLACDEGARHQRAGASPALRQPADPLHAGGARSRIRAAAPRHRPGAGHPGLEPAGRRPAFRQAPAQPEDAEGHAPACRLDGAADPRREPPVEHRRCPGRHRRGPWRLGGAGGARLAARPAGGHLAGHRRPDRGPAQGQSRRRRFGADAEGAPAPGRGQPAAAALSLLASAQHGDGPPQPRRSGAAAALSFREPFAEGAQPLTTPPSTAAR